MSHDQTKAALRLLYETAVALSECQDHDQLTHGEEAREAIYAAEAGYWAHRASQFVLALRQLHKAGFDVPATWVGPHGRSRWPRVEWGWETVYDHGGQIIPVKDRLAVVKVRAGDATAFRTIADETCNALLRMGSGADAAGEADRWESLGDAHRVFVQALYELSAFDVESLQSARDTVTRALGPDVDPANHKRALAALAKSGTLVRSRRKPGGYWLTPAGKALVEKHRPDLVRTTAPPRRH
jgi:hypothetical protein